MCGSRRRLDEIGHDKLRFSTLLMSSTLNLFVSTTTTNNVKFNNWSLVLKLLFVVVLVQLELRLWLKLLDLHHKGETKAEIAVYVVVPINDHVPAVEIHLMT